MSGDTFSPITSRRRRSAGLPIDAMDDESHTVAFVPASPKASSVGRRGPFSRSATASGRDQANIKGSFMRNLRISGVTSGSVTSRRSSDSERPVSARRNRTAGRNRAARRAPRVRRRLRPGGLYRWVRRFRIPIAIVMGLCAAAAAMLAAEGSSKETTQVVRVTSAVAAGEILSLDHVEVVEVDSQAVPDDHTVEIDDVLGRTMASALPAGALVHTSQLVGPGLLDGFEPGTVAVPVRPADTAMVGLISPGQRVDVLVSTDAPESETSTHRVAEDVPVLWIPQDDSENWIGASGDSRNVVILAVDAATAERVAQATHEGRLHLSLVGAGR